METNMKLRYFVFSEK